MTETIKLGNVKLADKNDVEELIDLIEDIEAPIVDNLNALGFELDDDMGEVSVIKGGVTIASYNIYIANNSAFVEVSLYNNPLSEQVMSVFNTSTFN